MMRKLATIQRIDALNPIPGADTIEVASVLGWKVVVKKGDFSVGALCVYCEIDSVLPDRPEFEFMRKKKFRIRTIRLRGQISQGIAFPLSILAVMSDDELVVGHDVTEYLGIEQFIPQIPACIAGEVLGPFPGFIPKTDETRVQVLQDVINRHAGMECYVTEKVDGSSCTYYLKDGHFGVCSRNWELKETEANAFWAYARKVKLEDKMKEFCYDGWALQGELIGPGIQKNNLKLPERVVLFYNVFDARNYQYLDGAAARAIVMKMGLEFVPLVDAALSLVPDVDHLVKYATRKSLLNPKVHAEGIVIRPLKETFDLQMAQGIGSGRLSFKVINPEYLLAFE